MANYFAFSIALIPPNVHTIHELLIIRKLKILLGIKMDFDNHGVSNTAYK